MPDEVKGPHLIPQGSQRRVAVPGRRLDGGLPATLVVIYDPQTRGWAYYLDTNPRTAILIGPQEVHDLHRGMA